MVNSVLLFLNYEMMVYSFKVSDAIKTRVLFLTLFIVIQNSTIMLHAQSVAVNSSNQPPNASAALDISSNSKGLLIPRMSSIQRLSLASPAIGLMVYDNVTSSFWFRGNSGWVELVDTLNNPWKNSGNNIVSGANSKIGIGASAPQYDLDIHSNTPNLSLIDTSTGFQSGLFTGDSSKLFINSYRKGLVSLARPGNILLQTSSGVSTAGTGNVGVGIVAPTGKLHIGGDERLNGDLLLSEANIDKFKVGINVDDLVVEPVVGNNFGRINLRSNGFNRMVIGSSGSKDFGSNSTGTFIPTLTIQADGEVNRLQQTGTSNLLPLCYGKVNLDGTIASGTGNFSVVRTGVGTYRITLANEPGLSTNQNNYFIFVNPFHVYGTTDELIKMNAGSYIDPTDNAIDIFLTKFRVDFTKEICSEPFAPSLTRMYINYTIHDPVDLGFSFLIFKK